MTVQKEWTLGNLIKKMRYNQGIGQAQLCRGICSVSTLSRIESGERDADYFLTNMIFQRLGYSSDKYEFYGSKKELEQWDQHCAMEQYRRMGKYDALEMEVACYMRQWEMVYRESPLQLQHIKFMQGILAGEKNMKKIGIELLEEAISLTVPRWRQEWYQEMVLGEVELDILDALGDAFKINKMAEDAYNIWSSILNYIEQKRTRRGEMIQRYVGTICKIAPYFIEKGKFRRCLELCEDGLKILSYRNKVVFWPDILFWKGKILEILAEDENIERELIMSTYKRCYYAYRIFENEYMAKKIKRHLEVEYQWDCIT